MKLFASALVLLPTVLVMAKPFTYNDVSPITEKKVNSTCNGVVAKLAVFGIHVDVNVCLDVGITKLTAHLPVPSIKTCAEAVAAANILGIEADMDVCLTTGGHDKEKNTTLMKNDGVVSTKHKKPSVPSKPHTRPSILPAQVSTLESPHTSKSCEAIIAKIHTLCGANIDVSVCLNLGINIDLLRLDRLKCRVIVDAAQIAGVSVELGVCDLFDGRINISVDKHLGL
ncbi:hypothetical protein K7432_013913 [Basidiobolus ranarum]|uniref:Hydrophobin n=1 Tax=Basidiobolus ranarum TaxID=34480 RepID=A0ABR2WIF8_9FUNG